MTDLMEAPVIVVSRKELAVRHLLKSAARADLPMPGLSKWNGLDVFVFARRSQIAAWEQFGLIRVAFGEFTANGLVSEMAFSDDDQPMSVIVSWPAVVADQYATTSAGAA